MRTCQFSFIYAGSEDFSITLLNKEKFYFDLVNIEHSWSGRMDTYGIGNAFIMEAEQLRLEPILQY